MSFAVIERTGNDKQPNITLSIPELDSINAHFKSGKVSYEDAYKMARKLVEGLFTERDKYDPKMVFNSANLKLGMAYFSERQQLQQNIDFKTLKAEITRAVEAVGQLSLVSATAIQLQEEINNRFEDEPNKQRRVVSRLNSILTWLNRGFKLVRSPEEFKEVVHVSEDVMQAACEHLDSATRLLVQTAFYTGCRLGECFALQPENFRKNHIFIAYQIDEKLKRRQTKNRKRRNAFIIPQGREVVEAWCKIPTPEKMIMRNNRYADMLTAATNNPDVVFHTLRHSYAYELAMRGLEISPIARFLGNSIQVCEKYYIGWIHEDKSMALIDDVFKDKKPG